MNLNNLLIITLKGTAMGAADLVPGISGGTVALITGIYQKLINDLKVVTSNPLLIIHFQRFVKTPEVIFLMNLLFGIVIGIVGLSRLIEFLFNNYVIATWSFIGGLVCSAVIFLVWQIKFWNIYKISLMFIGILIGQIIVLLPLLNTEHDAYIIFISGFLAISAMLLPGISGSYILVLLGQYTFMITAVNNLNVITLLTFIAGAITGLLTFTKFIYFIINRWKENTTVLMTGLIIGSLTKLWPWKDVLDKNTYPTNWENIYNNDPQILLSITLFISGITVAICISFLSIKLSKKMS